MWLIISIICNVIALSMLIIVLRNLYKIDKMIKEFEEQMGRMK